MLPGHSFAIFRQLTLSNLAPSNVALLFLLGHDLLTFPGLTTRSPS